jgi:proteasome lid subunit RPN8/RPN11
MLLDMDDKIKITTSPKDALNKIINWANAYPSIEICGFLGFDQESKKYITQLEENCSDDPKNFFAINALNYLLFKRKYSMLSIFHTHIIGDEEPSEFDIKMSENCCVPFLVYGLNTKNFKIYEPKNSEYDVKILERIKAKL